MGTYLWKNFIAFHGILLIREWLDLYGIDGLLERYTNWLVDMKKLDENHQ